MAGAPEEGGLARGRAIQRPTPAVEGTPVQVKVTGVQKEKGGVTGEALQLDLGGLVGLPPGPDQEGKDWLIHDELSGIAIGAGCIASFYNAEVLERAQESQGHGTGFGALAVRGGDATQDDFGGEAMTGRVGTGDGSSYGLGEGVLSDEMGQVRSSQGGGRIGPAIDGPQVARSGALRLIGVCGGQKGVQDGSYGLTPSITRRRAGQGVCQLVDSPSWPRVGEDVLDPGGM
jgi:hypothetical protein